MFEAYRVPRGYMPFWHFGARMGIGTVCQFYARMRGRGFVNVLDAGTGGGANVLLGSWMGFRVTACDLSPRALSEFQYVAQATTPAAQANCLSADSTNLPFRDGSFDVVIASHIIEHLDSPEILLRECLRVLRIGGVLRVSCPSQSHAMRVGKWFGTNLDPEDHKVIGYSSEEIAAMLPVKATIDRISFQGRVIESNVSDAQFVLARAMGMSGNPAVPGEEGAPSWALFALKEVLTLPLMVLAKIEDAIFASMKGSMITVEIVKGE
ncbi:MAG: methyltransferase domain-containing protein [Candidatus Hydrogenedentes bacterium]|nr:methyltransferase domain-containing protein [Candidatus Hydrogenedentota bacterium]